MKIAIMALTLVVLAGCSMQSATHAPIRRTGPTGRASSNFNNNFNHALVSSQPQAGYVFACAQMQRPVRATYNGSRSAQFNRSFNGSFNRSVDRNFNLPTPQLSMRVAGGVRTITSNRLHLPGNFTLHNGSLELPQMPLSAGTPSCVPPGMVGIAVDGVPIAGAFGARNVSQTMADCSSAPPMYAGASPCLPHVNDHDALVGYAMDGFGIYSMYNANGTNITNADLDACHGMTSVVPWDGKNISMYHYVVTDQYPFTVGCYAGTPVHVTP